MRFVRTVAVVAAALGTVCAVWACSSFGEGATAPAEAGVTDGAVSDAAMTEASPDAPHGGDSAPPSPCAVSRTLPPIPFAVRYSFTMSALVDDYVVQQTQSLADQKNLRVSLTPSGWLMDLNGNGFDVGPAGPAGATHTIAYRIESADGGKGSITVTFDGVPLSPLSADGITQFDHLQLGPFWPDSKPPLPVTVDYDNVTVWSCAP